jgi:hypothetical protein
MKRSILFVCLLLSGNILSTFAQGYYYYDDRHYDNPLLIELGLKAGGMNALTDIGGKAGPGKKGLQDLNLSFSRPCFSIFTSLLYQSRIGLRIQYTRGTVTAADSILKKDRASTNGRYERNLSFRSPVSELSVLLELRPFSFLFADNPNRLAPFLLAGIGHFRFDPQAKWEGNWYSLQPLHTEGQGFSYFPDRKPYSLQQTNFLAGTGLNYELNAWLNGRIEILHRFLKTDYLDDVSRDSYVPPAYFARELPAAKAGLARLLADRRAEVDPGHFTNTTYQRGNPGDRDAFFSLEIGLSLVIGRKKR